jgi:RNA polymerase sigma-70 factor, ECF subfamily
VATAIFDQRLRILGGLIRVTGDWALAEDCVQDAVERALLRWPDDGIPDNPAAWLTTAAYRRALDVLRRRRTEARKLQELASMARNDQVNESDPDPDSDIYRDDQLRLVFTCCHPALPLAGRVALTLKTVAGLSTAQIARAFLVSEATMGQRLLRARNKIAHTGIRLQVPEPHRITERTAGVLAVVYLVFTEGYATPETPGGADLAAEALRLAGLLSHLLPGNDEIHGLQALLLLQDARRSARTDSDGNLVPMEEQDRGQWNHSMIAAGVSELDVARASGRSPGQYRLQAEIAALHATAVTAAATDWARVVDCYDALLRAHPSPVVALNRAVAVGFRDGPEAGLDALAQLNGDARLGGYHLLPASRADLFRRAGRHQEAATAYRQALTLVESAAERAFLQRRLHELLTTLDNDSA